MKTKVLRAVAMVALTLTALSSVPAQAFGPSPAFQKEKSMSADKVRQVVLQDVREKINKTAPAVQKTYESTPLNAVLVTDYAEIDYPSRIENTDEGLDGSGEPVLDALKKPITETSKIQLAELVRFYQFNMTDGLSFAPLDPESKTVYAQNLRVEDKLNYFDYIKLIDTIADNSQYDNKEKVARLNQVEKDLDASIKLLYGDTRTTMALESWGDTKRVSTPFKQDRYSYKQLLAAYEKSEVVIATLSYYSAILDALEEIKNYSIDRRMHRQASIDADALAANINERYKMVSEILIAPVSDIISAQQDDRQRYEAAKKEEEEALKNAGLGGDGQ